MIIAILQLLCSFYETIRTYVRILSATLREEISGIGRSVVQLYDSLALMYYELWDEGLGPRIAWFAKILLDVW